MPPDRRSIYSSEADTKLSFSGDFISWSETIKSGDGGGFRRKGGGGGGAWVRMSTGGEDFSLSARQDGGGGGDEGGDGSGTPSPTLWGKKVGGDGHDRQVFDEMPLSGELNPRSQIIAKHRQEMMELVRDMPESSYELSLRDIVELRVDDKGNKAAAAAAKERKREPTKNGAAARRPVEKDAAVRRSQSLDTGMLLKMFLPGRTTMARSSAAPRPRTKVLSRQQHPPAAEVEKGPDVEWWKRKEGGKRSTGSCSSSRGGGSSINSSSSGGSSGGGGFGLSRNGSVSGGGAVVFSGGASEGGGRGNILMPMSRRFSDCLPFLKSSNTRSGGAFGSDDQENNFKLEEGG